MAFFLGKDVTITALTEATTAGVAASEGAVTFPTGASPNATYFATKQGGTAASWNQITSCDLSIGAMDEDISYFGIRSQTKAEIKKETTVTFTRKKTNAQWDGVFNDARYGVTGTAALDGLEEPTVNHGYRIFITIAAPTRNAAAEVVTLMNCCVQSHTVTVNTDGTMDETLELMTYVSPVYQSTAYTTPTAITAL